jgi:hypothetical protein
MIRGMETAPSQIEISLAIDSSTEALKPQPPESYEALLVPTDPDHIGRIVVAKTCPISPEACANERLCNIRGCIRAM